VPARTRIVFTGGTAIEVEGTVGKVRGKLSRGKPYAKFATVAGEVHVHRAQVAYVAAPDPAELPPSAGEESFRSGLRQRPRKARAAARGPALRTQPSAQPASS